MIYTNLNKIHKIERNYINNFYRLGRKMNDSTKVGPIKIILINEELALVLLKNKKKCDTAIKINSEKTLRQYLNLLKYRLK